MESDEEQLQKLNIALWKQFISRICEQITSQTYDLNSCTRFILEARTTDSLLQQMIGTNKNKQMENQSKYYDQIIEQLRLEIVQFTWLVGNLPKLWIEMLQNQRFHSINNEINLKILLKTQLLDNFMNQCQKINLKQFLKLFRSSNEIKSRIIFLMQVIGCDICRLYDLCKEVIMDKINNLQQYAKDSKLMNSFILYHTLRDLGVSISNQVEDILREGLFRNGDAQIFTQFILEKHQIIKMVSRQQVNLQNNEVVNSILSGCKVKLRSAFEGNNKNSVLVQFKDQKKKQIFHFIVFYENERLKIINSRIIRKNWRVSKLPLKSNNLSQYLIVLQNNKPKELQPEDNYDSISNYAVLSGNLGKTLIKIKKYSGIGQFTKDLSKTAVIRMSFNEVLANSPVIGMFLAAGSLSFNFYKIFINKSTDNRRKMQQISNLAINTTSVIGSSIMGAAIGQTFIPIPVLGAFIGSVVGGYLGQKGGSKVSRIFDQKRFRHKIQYLRKELQEGYWKPNQQIFKELRMSQSEFMKSIPKKLYSKSVSSECLWITMICFVIVSFYQSQRLQEFNCVKVKQYNKNNPINENEEEPISKYKQVEVEINFQQIDNQEAYQCDINLMETILLLEKQGIKIINYLDLMENITLPILVKDQ